MPHLNGYPTHVGEAYIRFNPDTKQPDVSRYNIGIMTGGRMPLAPEAHTESETFYNGLTYVNKEPFNCFRHTRHAD